MGWRRVVKEVFEILESLHKEGITILLVEQNVRQTLNIADRAYVLENGHLVLEGVCSLLKQSDHVRKAYLGSLAVPRFGVSFHLVAQRPLPRERPFDTVFGPKV